MSTGMFVVSIDYEFALGFADFDLSEAERKNVAREVNVIKRLLTLFEKYRIPATWAVVGHLLERSCLWRGNLPHPEYPRPINREERRDWFKLHPPEGEYDDVLWFDSQNLVAEIMHSPVGHEIGSHSYGHIIYGAPDINEAAVEVDVSNAVRVHKEANLSAASFVFPRNKPAFHKLLKAYGFLCVRQGGDRRLLPGFAGRMLHRLLYALPFAPVGLPLRHASGLLQIPASMDIPSRKGLRRLMLPSMLFGKARSGLHRASRRGEIFHLWFHPSNFVYEADTQFQALEKILKEASRLRRAGKLEIVTMRQIARRFEKF